jgi:DNA-binding Lrp family transcriptional regulator
MRTMLYLTVLPADLEAAGQALAAHPEVPFAAATTGRTNVYATVASPDAAALYRYLTTRVAALPGVQGVETAPVIRTVKAAGTHYPAAAHASSIARAIDTPPGRISSRSSPASKAVPPTP